jgi:hypothetical protein
VAGWLRVRVGGGASANPAITEGNAVEGEGRGHTFGVGMSDPGRKTRREGGSSSWGKELGMWARERGMRGRMLGGGGCARMAAGIGAGRGRRLRAWPGARGGGCGCGSGSKRRQSDGFGWRRGWQSDGRDGGGGMVVLVYTIALRISRD